MGAQELGEENKENNPSETAVLQQTVNRLNMDLHELRVVLSNKDADIQKLNSECSQLRTQLQEVVSICIVFHCFLYNDLESIVWEENSCVYSSLLIITINFCF